MATGEWIGVSGIARKVKTPFVGVSGIARKVKSGWVGVGNVARKYYEGIVKIDNDNASSYFTVKKKNNGYSYSYYSDINWWKPNMFKESNSSEIQFTALNPMTVKIDWDVYAVQADYSGFELCTNSTQIVSVAPNYNTTTSAGTTTRVLKANEYIRVASSFARYSTSTSYGHFYFNLTVLS